MEALQLAVEVHGGGCRLIRVRGALTRRGAARLLRLVDSQLAVVDAVESSGSLVIDLEAVGHYEPGALECLRHAHHAADRRGTPLFLTGWVGRPLPQRMQAILQEFPSFSTVERALADLVVEPGVPAF
ncbi:hypothetical protein [Pseudonocardia pini]|uniref:hypothetical protein n=1 Tax=Pseudonocardia pini TaxID=2758030 RepID=UPI0015F03D99|nr:hypothetical protein [Pseudonocardia pini]